MTLRQSTAFRLALVGAAAPAALLLGAGPALAATDVTVSNTETIQAHLDASGKVKDKRVYEQLAFTGQGSVDVANPVSTDGLRNLDGFGGFDVKDGKLVTKVDVSGEKRLRTVSNFTKELPLKVEITYTLDGKQVKPGDVVGKSGILEVHYKVTNVTGKSRVGELRRRHRHADDQGRAGRHPDGRLAVDHAAVDVHRGAVRPRRTWPATAVAARSCRSR